MSRFFYCLLILTTSHIGISQSRSKRYFTNNDRQESINCVSQTSDGNFVLAGSGFNSNQGLMIYFKIDDEGNLLWERTYNHLVYPRPSKIVAMPDGGFGIVGTGNGGVLFLGIYDENGIEMAQYFYKPNKLSWASGFELLESGDFLISGSSDINPDPLIDEIELFILRLDKNGNEIYDSVVKYGDNENGNAVDMVIPNEDFIYSAALKSYADSSIDEDMILTQWQLSNGELMWEKIVGKGYIAGLELSRDSLSLVAAFTSHGDVLPKAANVMTIDFNGQIETSFKKQMEFAGLDVASLVVLMDGSYALSSSFYDFEFDALTTKLIHFSETGDEICETDILEGTQTLPKDLLLTQQDRILMVNEARESYDTHQFPVVSLLESVCDSIEILSSNSKLSDTKVKNTFYPNPFDELVHSNLHSSLYKLRLEIYNSMGMLVNKDDHFDSRKVQTEELEPGLYYFLIYQNENLLSIEKLIKL